MATTDIFGRKSITQTGPDAISLTDPNLGDASFSRQGVVDQSGIFKGQAKAAAFGGAAQAIQGLGQAGLDLDKRFALLDLEKQVQAEAIDPFIESRQPGFAEKQRLAYEEASIDNFELEQRGNAIRAVKGEGAAIQQLDPEFASVTARLKSAKRKGAMSENELQIRIKAATREAINKRPGLMQELTAHAQNVLGLSGAEEMQDLQSQLDAAEAKREAEVRKGVLSTLRSISVPHDPINMPTEQLVNLMNNSFVKRNAFESFANDQEMQSKLSEIDTKQLVESGAPQDIIFGGYDVNMTKVLDLFHEDMAPNDFTKAKNDALAIVHAYDRQIATNPTFIRLQGIKEIKELKDNQISNFRETVERLSEAASGADARLILENDLAIARSTSERNIYDVADPAALRLRQGLADSFPMLAKDANLRKPIEDFFIATSNGGINAPAIQHGYRKTLDPNKSNFASVLGVGGIIPGAIPKVGEDPKKSAAKKPEEYAKMFDSAFQTIEQEPDVEKRATIIRDLVKEMGNPGMRDYYDNLPIQTQDQYLELLDKQVGLVTNSIDDVFKKAESAGLSIRSRMIEGRMRFTTDDTSPKAQQFIRRENLRVAEAHSDVIQAFSVRFGKSFKDTSAMLQKVFTQQDRHRLFDVLDEFEEGIQEGRKTSSSIGSATFMDKLVAAESGGNPEAKAPTSNAVGLTQFIPSTWNRMIDRFAPELRSGKTEQEVLDLRKDPELSKQMAQKLAEDNASILSNQGLPTDDSALHLSHLLGVGTASEVLSANPNTPLSEVVGSAAIKANKNIMEGKRVKDLISWSQAKMGD